MFAIARAPLRVSFFGGGTDYPEYFVREPGAVVGAAIDRYIYIAGSTILWLADYRYRVSYSKTERVNNPAEIEHPVVREALKRFYYDSSLDLNIFSDIPAQTGLGSSSTFTTCLLKLLAHMGGTDMTPMELALKAHHMEREILKENVGIQDQLHSSYGGVNRFDFHGDKVTQMSVRLSGIGHQALSQSLHLVFTNKTRSAHETLKDQVASTTAKKLDKDLRELYDMVGECVRILENPNAGAMVDDLGRMMHEGWQVKKRLSSSISNPEIDDVYERALQAGALGGKLCGAGSGGFMLMIVPPERSAHFIKTMGEHQVLPVGIDRSGASIVQQTVLR